MDRLIESVSTNHRPMDVSIFVLDEMEPNATENETDIGEIVSNRTSQYLGVIYDYSPIITAVKVVIGIMGVIGNLLVVIVVRKQKKLFLQVKSVYIINQSFIDGLTSAVLVPMSLLRADLLPAMEPFTAQIYCKLWLSQVPLWGLMASSTYNLVAISIERYMAVAHPLWHKTSFTDTKSRVSMIVIWLFGVSYVTLLMVPTSRVDHGICFCSPSYFWPSREAASAVGLLRIFVSWLLPFVVHCVCYSRILVILSTRVAHSYGTNTTAPGPSCVTPNANRNMDVLPSTSAAVKTSHFLPPPGLYTPQNLLDNVRQKQNDRTRKNVINTFAVVTACFFLCWTPQKIFMIMYAFGIVSTFGNVYQVTTLLVFVNCCINPLIYIAKLDAFKKAVLALIR